MQFLFAFIIFAIVIYILGVLFSFLWPLFMALVVIAAIANLIAYYRHRTTWRNLYEQTQSFHDDATDRYGKGEQQGQDDIIDVEYSETRIDDER